MRGGPGSWPLRGCRRLLDLSRGLHGPTLLPSPTAVGVTLRHAFADILLDAILREGVAEAVLGQRRHAIDGLVYVLGRQRHQHLGVEHAAIAALGDAWAR